jgi:peptidoglycan/LPS O-acetylase OafA/YrhL
VPVELAAVRGALGALGGGLVVAGAVLREAGGGRPVLRGAGLRRLGLWSYGIYLINVLLLCGLAPRVPLDAPPALAAAVLATVVAGLTVALAAALHHGVERPALRLRGRPAREPAAAPVAA